MEKIIDMNAYLSKQEQKSILDFITTLTKLSPIEMLGISTILKVPIYAATDQKPKLEDAETRPIEEIIGDMIEAFHVLNREQKRNMLRLMKGKLA